LGELHIVFFIRDKSIIMNTIPFHAHTKPLVLAVDDIVDNLTILEVVLQAKGFRVITAMNGVQAVEILKTTTPDIALLDIQMPEMNGYELCKFMKQQPHLQDVPVLFITAQSELSEIVEGFKVGAVDYVLKPFKTAELLARVQTHYDLKQARDTIAKKNQQLETLIEGLRRLNEEKSDVVGIAAHDLKNPITAIHGLAEILHTEDNIPNDAMRAMLEQILSASSRMFSIVRGLLDITHIEQEQRLELTDIDFVSLVQNVVHQYEVRAEKKSIRLCFESAFDEAWVHGHVESLVRVMDNLISNAVKYSFVGKQVLVQIHAEMGTAQRVRCAIHNEGEGISEQDQTKLFTKFARLHSRPTANEDSTGLGLYIVKRLVSEMQGNVWCESALHEGATFVVEFPLVQ
jgi:two-component system, sensor histidine kinase and response regulator